MMKAWNARTMIPYQTDQRLLQWTSQQPFFLLRFLLLPVSFDKPAAEVWWAMWRSRVAALEGGDIAKDKRKEKLVTRKSEITFFSSERNVCLILERLILRLCKGLSGGHVMFARKFFADCEAKLA
jgi:hypothetical protein